MFKERYEWFITEFCQLHAAYMLLENYNLRGVPGCARRFPEFLEKSNKFLCLNRKNRVL